MSRESRLEKLFIAISQGLSAEEAYGQLEQGTQGQARGVETEQIVRRALSDLPFVSGVQILSRKPRFDQRGIDIRVILQRQDAGTSLKYVDVQVKSSQKAVREYRRELRRRYGLTEEEFEEWRRAERRVFLDGRNPPEEIREDFLRQLTEIIAFHGHSK